MISPYWRGQIHRFIVMLPIVAGMSLVVPRKCEWLVVPCFFGGWFGRKLFEDVDGWKDPNESEKP